MSEEKNLTKYKAPPTVAKFIQSEASESWIVGPVGCLPAETEFLTDKGWVRMDAYEPGMRVAQWLVDGTVEFVEPIEYVKLPCKSFHRFKNAHAVDMAVSDEHRVPYFDYRGKLKEITGAALAAKFQLDRTERPRYYIPTTFRLAEGATPGLRVPDDLIRLHVAFAADGTVPKRGKRVNITIRKERKKQRLREMLTRLGVEYDERTYSGRPTEAQFWFVNPGVSKQLLDLREADQRQLQIIHDELPHWDGLFEGPDWRFSTSKKTEADFVQYVLAATGHRASICAEDYPDKPNWNTIYTVHAVKALDERITFRNTEYSMAPANDGHKYCFVVPSSYFVVRNNDRVFITGNSGKTVGGLMKIIYHASRQAPNKDGIRKSRFAVVRDTYENLRATTHRSWLDWCPDGKAGTWMSSMKTFYLKMGDVESEVIWLGLDDQKDVARLLSLELTGIFFDEFVFISESIVEAAAGRIGRYPSMKDGGPTWYGMWGSTNPGTVEDWWYNRLYKEIPSDPIRAEEVKLFVQPGARTPRAENLDNLHPEYYAKLQRTKSAEWQAQFLDVEWAPGKGGSPVHPMFSRSIHVSPHQLIPSPSYPLLIGYDPGVSYMGLCFAQYDHMNHRVFFHHPDFILEDMGAERLVKEVVRPLLNTTFKNVSGRVLWCMDPAARNRSAGDERSAYGIIKAAGFQCAFHQDNSIRPRLDAVDQFLGRNTNQGPALVIDPRCEKLIAGFAHGYRYKLSKTGVKSDVPEKNSFSHLMDSGQYVCQNAGKSLTAVNRSTSQTAPGMSGPAKNIYRT